MSFTWNDEAASNNNLDDSSLKQDRSLKQGKRRPTNDTIEHTVNQNRIVRS